MSLFAGLSQLLTLIDTDGMCYCKTGSLLAWWRLQSAYCNYQAVSVLLIACHDGIRAGQQAVNQPIARRVLFAVNRCGVAPRGLCVVSAWAAWVRGALFGGAGAAVFANGVQGGAVVFHQVFRYQQQALGVAGGWRAGLAGAAFYGVQQGG